MGFDHGTLTFRVCSLPEPLPKDALERFNADHAGPLERVSDEPSAAYGTLTNVKLMLIPT